MYTSFRVVAVLALAGVAACGDKGETNAATAEPTPRVADADVRRDIALPNPPAPQTQKVAARDAERARANAAAQTMTVAAGATMSATIQDSLSSRVNKSGEVVHAVLSENLMDATGLVMIPAGSVVALTIVKLEPGSDQVRPEGRLELATTSVSIKGRTYPLSATIGPIPHTMKGRGITKDEAARVAGGAAIGAAIGQVIGKNTKSTVIGAAAGTVVGGAAAARYAYRDVIVSPGAAIILTLTETLVVAR